MFRARIFLALALAPAAAAQTVAAITEVCPTATSAGSPDTVVSIRGTGFDYPNVSVVWRPPVSDLSTPLTVQAFIPGPQFQTLQVLVPARLLAQPGSATISVTNTRVPPTVNFSPVNPTVILGQSVTLDCAATNADLILITGSGIGNTNSVQSTTSPLRTTIMPRATSDYVCTAFASGFPSVSQSTTVTVQTRVPATVTFLPGNVSITQGGTVTLDCSATNADLIRITGPGVGTTAGAATGFVQSTTSPLRTVVAPNVTSDYVCTASASGLPDVSQRITITVGQIPSVILGRTPATPARAADPLPRAAVASFLIVPAPTLTGVTPPTATEGTPLSLVLSGTNFFPSIGSCTPGSTATWDDLDLTTTVSATASLVAAVPASLVTPGTHRVRVVNPGGIGSQTLTVTVARTPVPPSISTSTLPDGIVSQVYQTTTILAPGFTGLRWSLSPDIGLRIDPATGLVSGTPTVDGQFDLVVRADDPATELSATRIFPIRILPAVSLSLTGLAATITTRNNQTLEVTLANPYPVDVRGRLSLTFDAETGVAGAPPVRDPALQFGPNPPGFLNGDVLIHAGATVVRVPLQSGSVAGTITAELSAVTVNGGAVTLTPVRATARIPSGPPVIASCIEERSPGLLRVRTVGVSTTREIQSAVFRFAPRVGRTVETPEVRADNLSQSLFGPYYASQFADFDYRQDFRVEGENDAIESVTVTLSNARGASAPAVAAGDCRSLP